jgi:MOSC domain
MTDVPPAVGDAVTGFVAGLTGRSRQDLPSPAANGDEWLALLRQWLARQGFGLVSIASPGAFSWPGHWIGIVDRPNAPAGAAAVLLFGTSSAVIASPGAPELLGRGVEDLDFREGLILVPFDPFGTALVDRDRKIGEVVGIYIASEKTAPMRSVARATAVPGKGLASDRYAAAAGTFTPRSARLRGYDLTLIESEVLDRFPLADGTRLAPNESRRNVVTKGVDLNALVGSEFRIGSVRAFGQRLCEPCVHLQRLTRPGVVEALVHRGGLRADLLSDGEIRVGDRIEAAAGAT